MMAFIVHLRDENDMDIFFPKELCIAGDKEQTLNFIKKNGGCYTRSVVKQNNKIIGYIVAMPLTAIEILQKSGRYAILNAVYYAQNLGCTKIGLGVLTKSVTNGGKWLLSQPNIKATISNCNSLPTGMAIEGIKEIIKKTGKFSLAIIGAYGNIGEVIAKTMAQEEILLKEIFLIGKDSIKLEEIKSNCKKTKINISISTNIKEIKKADIVVSVTNAVSAIISAEHLKKDAIIYDLSQPRNCDPSLLNERPDIKILDGPLCQVPGKIDFWWMGLPEHLAFPCMCENILFEELNLKENSVGRLRIEFIEKITKEAKIYGFKLADFTSFGYPMKV